MQYLKNRRKIKFMKQRVNYEIYQYSMKLILFQLVSAHFNALTYNSELPTEVPILLLNLYFRALDIITLNPASLPKYVC